MTWSNKCSNLPGSDSSIHQVTAWFPKVQSPRLPMPRPSKMMGGWEDGRWCFPKKWLKLQSNTPFKGDIMILKYYGKICWTWKIHVTVLQFKGPKLGKLGIWQTMTNCTVYISWCWKMSQSQHLTIGKILNFQPPDLLGQISFTNNFTPPDIFSQFLVSRKIPDKKIHFQGFRPPATQLRSMETPTMMLRCPNRQEAEEWEETRLGWGFEDP